MTSHVEKTKIESYQTSRKKPQALRKLQNRKPQEEATLPLPLIGLIDSVIKMGKICYRQVFLEKNKIYCERKISKFIGAELELDYSSESDYSDDSDKDDIV